MYTSSQKAVVMQVRQLLSDDDAVSPVIGVILMVAITVILAAVIASFVLGLGGQTNQTPQASFSFDYNSLNDEAGIVTVTHDGGATIKANELVFRGQGYNNSMNTDASPGPSVDYTNPDNKFINSSNTKWSALDSANVTANGDKGGDSAVVSGDYAKITANNDFEIQLVYESSEGDNSATIAEETGPETS